MRIGVKCSVVLLCLTGCASIHPDHFYALEPQPAANAASKQNPATAVGLKVSVPAMVDRNELVLRNGNGVTVLEHERWAAPLADQVAIVLGQDIEQRRPDLLISSRRPSQAGGPPIGISVDIVELSAARAGVSIEARWRIDFATGTPALIGRERFSKAAAGNDYAQLAQAISGCVAQIAERLIQQLPPSMAPTS